MADCGGRGSKFPGMSPFALGNGRCVHGKIKPHYIDPRAAECELIQSVAADVIARVMAEGAKTHAVGEWRGVVSEHEHLLHAKAHLRHGRRPLVTDFEHAIVRLLMIVAKAREAGK